MTTRQRPLPCTPRGIVELLRAYGVALDGAEVCIVGRGVTVGRPLGLLLTRRSENLFFTKMKRFLNEPKIVAILETFDLLPVRDRLVKNLSLGEKRRLEIAMAVLAEPEVLLLDEPLAGLAESEIKGVLEVLRRQFGKQTILIVEHKISHVKDFVQRLMVMHEGRVIAEGGYEECLNHPEVRKSYWQIDDSATEEPAHG